MKKRLQAVLLFIVIGILTVGATGCSLLTGSNGGTTATATPDPNATIPPQQVVDADYTLYDKAKDFSIQYHNQWKIKTNLSDDGSINLDRAEVVFTIPEGMKQTQETATQVYPTLSVFQFSIEEKDRESFSLLSYVKEQVNYLESKVFSFTMLKEITEGQIGTVTAYTIEYDATIFNSEGVRVKQVFLTDGENVFVLTYAANGTFRSDESYGAIADKMINSFLLK